MTPRKAEIEDEDNQERISEYEPLELDRSLNTLNNSSRISFHESQGIKLNYRSNSSRKFQQDYKTKSITPDNETIGGKLSNYSLNTVKRIRGVSGIPRMNSYNNEKLNQINEQSLERDISPEAKKETTELNTINASIIKVIELEGKDSSSGDEESLQKLKINLTKSKKSLIDLKTEEARNNNKEQN